MASIFLLQQNSYSIIPIYTFSRIIKIKHLLAVLICVLAKVSLGIFLSTVVPENDWRGFI